MCIHYYCVQAARSRDTTRCQESYSLCQDGYSSQLFCPFHSISSRRIQKLLVFSVDHIPIPYAQYQISPRTPAKEHWICLFLGLIWGYLMLRRGCTQSSNFLFFSVTACLKCKRAKIRKNHFRPQDGGDVLQHWAPVTRHLLTFDSWKNTSPCIYPHYTSPLYTCKSTHAHIYIYMYTYVYTYTHVYMYIST